MKKLITRIILSLWQDYLNEKQQQIDKCRAGWEFQGEQKLIYGPPSGREFIEDYLKPTYKI